MIKISNIHHFTKLGLVIAFFGASLVLIPFQIFVPDPLTNSIVIVRELLLFLVTGLLVLIVLKGDKLGLNSIGLHNRDWGKSILWRILLIVMFYVLVAGCLGVFKLVGISVGNRGNKYDNISPRVTSLMMLRAGVMEEVLYCGHIMQRLNKISNNWMFYLLVPSIIFGLLHYSQGIGGIIIATLSGVLFSLFYWKKRDLKINIFAHFMADIIPNVLIPIIAENN